MSDTKTTNTDAILRDFRDVVEHATENYVPLAQRNASLRERTERAYAELWAVCCDLLEPIVQTVNAGHGRYTQLGKQESPCTRFGDGFKWDEPHGEHQIEAATRWLRGLEAPAAVAEQNEEMQQKLAIFERHAAEMKTELAALRGGRT